MSATLARLPALPGAAPARRRHLRVVPDVRARRLRWILVLGVVVVVASTFLLVVFNVLVAQGQIELDRLSQRLEEEQRTYERRRLEVAELAAPGSLLAAAEALGMVRPEQVGYVEAPEAARAGAEEDTTSSTLEDSRDVVRSSLAGAG